MEFSDLYFVVGSARSGTKIFRDTLDAHPDITTTDHPLEEIWTMNQGETDHDAYEPETLTEETRDTIRNRFKELMGDSRIFVEKNVRNSLRIDYVSAVFPEARFLHIIRHPLDVIVSLRERWKNPIDWKYYLSLRGLKLSPVDIIYYSLRLGSKFVRKLFQGKSHVDVWGPYYPGLVEDIESYSLTEVCALQWKHCVQNVRRNLGPDDENYFEFHYEDLMRNPEPTLTSLAEFMAVDSVDPWLDFARSSFRTESIGRGRSELTNQEINDVASLLDNWPSRLGYTLKVASSKH